MFTTTSNNSEKRWPEKEERIHLPQPLQPWSRAAASKLQVEFHSHILNFKLIAFVFTQGETAAFETEHAVHASFCPQVPCDWFHGSIIDGAKTHNGQGSCEQKSPYLH